LRLQLSDRNIDLEKLEKEWRSLYYVAWADFQRFLLGWSPGHTKNNGYSQRITETVCTAIQAELLAAATSACRKAGKYIHANWKKKHHISSKGLHSRAADVLTEIDLHAQEIILAELKSSIQYYNLGVLAEEGTQDTSRHQKHAFWTIDPLDGTQFYVEGKEGFAVSIALVSKTGEPILGVVYNPVNDTLYHAFKGQGLYINDLPHSSKNNNITQQKMTLYADKSIEKHPLFEHFQSSFDIQYSEKLHFLVPLPFI